ncbi:hypothetical protein CYMTET_49019 [Cymbomonas tetramitiformis]|uniref:Cytosine-specific methyltransferase n=1 Tax=Cymbomonas tetramitiformis TaxID=36881 RepID=A0AAE0EUA9_9CHLO|nr:hypothetical protein CYMTET_49019 [Cymbomonas tetramitiformis]
MASEKCNVHGVPTGAFVVARREADTLRKTLRRLKWLKPGINTTPYTAETPPGLRHTALAASSNNSSLSPLCAIHVSQIGAACMSSAAPDSISTFLAAGTACWMPRLRVRDLVCLGRDSACTPPPAAPSARFTFSELFAGIGGFRIALDKLGGKSIFTSEIDPEARDVYEGNFGDRPDGDITEIETDCIGPHDILTGGFPCQTFSLAGNTEGFEDPRGMLFLEIVRVLHACAPRAFILENVANLAFMQQGTILRSIIAELSGAGYDVSWRLINSRVVLPQQRIRVYLVGLRRDQISPGAPSFRWPELPVLDTALRDVLEDPSVDDDPRWLLTKHQQAKVEQSAEYRIDPQLRLARLDGCARTLMSNYRTSFNVRSEFVWRPSAPGPRFYTVSECAALQGFPHNFRYQCATSRPNNANRAYFQLGNAVCPIIVAAIAASVLEALAVPPLIPPQPSTSTLPAGVTLATIPKSPRSLVAPALELLLEAAPAAPGALTGSRQQLLRQCAAFLRTDLVESGAPAGCTGRGPEFLAADQEVTRRLLESRQAGAELSGLTTLGRVAYYEVECGGPQGATAAMVAAGLVILTAGLIVHGSVAEVRRLAVVTLAILCRQPVAAATLVTSHSTVEALWEVIAVTDSRTAKQAEEILHRIGHWTKCLGQTGDTTCVEQPESALMETEPDLEG